MNNGLYLYKCNDGSTLVRKIEFINDNCYCNNGFPNGTNYCKLEELLPLPNPDYPNEVKLKKTEPFKWK